MSNVPKEGQFHVECRFPTDGHWGLFAPCTIKAGQRIFAESPICTINKLDTDPWDIYHAIKRMSEEDAEKKREFNELPVSNDLPVRQRDRALMDNIDNHRLPNPATRGNIWLLKIRRAYRERNNRAMDEGDGREATRWVGVFERERILMSVKEKNFEGALLFRRFARIKHSCVPNCVRYFDADSGQIVLHAIRDIEPLHELTIMDNREQLIFQPANIRWPTLYLNYGLTCQCPGCDPSTQFGQQSVAASVANVERHEKLSATTLELNNEQNPKKRKKIADKIIDLCEGVLTLLERQDVRSWDKGVIHLTRSHAFGITGHFALAAKELEYALEIANFGFGKDHSIYKYVNQLLQPARQNAEKDLDKFMSEIDAIGSTPVRLDAESPRMLEDSDILGLNAAAGDPNTSFDPMAGWDPSTAWDPTAAWGLDQMAE